MKQCENCNATLAEHFSSEYDPGICPTNEPGSMYRFWAHEEDEGKTIEELRASV